MRVLVAEDDEDIRALVAMILGSAGYRPETYSSGRSALEASQHDVLAIYVVDVQMPDVTGLDLCRQLRTNPATRNSRVLLMSADTAPHNIAAALAAGADGFLAKPFTRKELLSRVDQLINPPMPRTA